MNDIVKESEDLVSSWVNDPTLVKFIILAVGLLVIRFLVKLVQRTATRKIDSEGRNLLSL